MDANENKILYKELSFEIIGAAMEVLNFHGHGLHEKIYENSLVVEGITDIEIGQVMNYLRLTKLKLGIILNFRYPKLQYKRVVLSN